jgi:hypothetical protein
LSRRACVFFPLDVTPKLDVSVVNQVGELMRGHRSSLNRLGDKTVVPLLANGHLIGLGAFQFVFRAENGLEIFHRSFADALTMRT